MMLWQIYMTRGTLTLFPIHEKKRSSDFKEFFEGREIP